MPHINSDNRDAWQALANDASKARPDVGKRVRVLKGKYAKREGLVKRHMLDKFSDAFRYGSPAAWTLREMQGRYGYVVLVETSQGSFWVKASNVEII